jgi:hypothetical protein
MLLGDQTAKAFVDGMVASGAGPEWFFFVLLLICIVLLIWKGFMPIYERKVNADIDLEKQREDRKAEESKAREKRDIERSKMEGRWIEAMERSTALQEQTNVELNAIRTTNEALIEQIKESREGSRGMQDRLNSIEQFIKEKK